jgi:hypothetical protein
LILFACIFGLTECKATVAPHALHSTDFLDGFLEPGNTVALRNQSKHLMSMKHTVLAVDGSQVYCIFEVLERYGTMMVYMFFDSWDVGVG